MANYWNDDYTTTMSIDSAFNFRTPQASALAAIDSTKYPDTNKDFQQNIIRLNQFVDYIASYLQTMQKSIDSNSQDPIAQIQGVASDLFVLLGGGELLYGIDLGDLQYLLPAIGALLGFDSTTPFPINLFNAAEHFLLGYVVPLDSFGTVIEGIIDGWLVALGIDQSFIDAVNSVLDAIDNLVGSFETLLTDVENMIQIMGPIDEIFADLWHAITVLLGGADLSSLGSLIDPIFHTIAPWIQELATGIDELVALINAFAGGVRNVQAIINFASLFTPFLNLLDLLLPPAGPGTMSEVKSGAWDYIAAWETLITNAIMPHGLLAPLIADATGSAGLTGFVPLENLAMEAIAGVIGGAQSLIDSILVEFGYAPGSGTEDDVAQIFANIYDFVGNPANFTTDIFNVATAVENFITSLLQPTNMLAPMNPSTSLLSAVNIPGLDASKIVTGILSMLQIPPSVLNTGSAINAQNLYNQVSSALLGMVPYSHIGNANPNLLASFSFDTAATIGSIPSCTWNGTSGHTSPGCAQFTASGALITLVAPSPIQVTQGQQLTISGWINYTGLTATAGQNAIRINAAQYLGTTVGAVQMVASVLSPGASSGGWVQITGTYTVPAGVDNILVQLQVTAAATAGTVLFDDVSATKTGLMSGNWMSGISGTVAADIQSAVDQIFQSSHGGSSTNNALTSILNSLTNIPGSSLLSLDATKITTGIMNILQIPTNQLGIGNITDIQSLSDYITNALVGATSFFGTTLPQANSSMNSIFANVVNNTQSIQAMSSTAGGASALRYWRYRLRQLSRTWPLPSTSPNHLLAARQSDAGHRTNLAGWANLVNDADRAAVVVYNVAPTSTDYQYLQGAMASPPPEETFYNTYPRIWALGRVDNPANPQNYVWARAYSNGFLSYVADIGCTVAGVDTVWVSGIQLTWTTSIALSFGVGGNPRRYQVFSGTQLVYDYTESGTTSRLGAGFRYWGLKTEMKKWVTGTDGSRGGDPGSLAGCSVYDNGPQTFAGSGASFYRAGGAVTCTSTFGTPLKFPAAFFDTAIGVTSDMSSAANAVTIGISGWYTATIRSKITINVGTGNLSLSPVVFKNNAAHRAGTPLMQANIVGTQATTSALCGSIEFYAAAGDVIEPGYLFENVNSGSISGNFQCSGDATAVGTYWTLAMTNRSLA